MVDVFDLELTAILDPQPVQEADTQQRLLRVCLSEQDTALVPLEQITEVLNVETTTILPVPEMPGCVLGIHNWRGNMLWLVDFSHLVGYPSVLQQQQIPRSLTVLVAEINHQFVGVGVQQVYTIELHDLQQLQPSVPGLFPPGLLPMVQGILPNCCDAVLDVQAITECSLWKTYQGKHA